ncbi:MAG: multifunctional CCA addition/repair protein [Gammaproteobacteria bacterium]|nr:multifunctional CCA addition/repair protein [Gammaproteobacteria bacterium]
METYLVGGAVRDKLLGLPVRERDWVVVGATPATMLELGYTPVGKDFPVFLHPQTKEEYALARTERKTGPGYTGFDTCADPDITLEEDLLRRDLTINAMAESSSGELIDPYGGREDLDNGVLKHVSPAFAEDPVRVLRIARFAARFATYGFHVAHSTNAMMRSMVQNGEVNHLVPERVWVELVKALETDTPARFFDVLAGCSALPILFPEFAVTDSGAALSAPAAHGQNGPGLPVLEQAVALSENTAIRFAALVCDMDNSTTDGLSNDALAALCERHRAPNSCRELAEMALRQREQVQLANTLSATELLELLNTLDAFRRTDRFGDFLQVCEAAARACQRKFNGPYLNQALAAAQSVRADALQKQGLSGKEIGEALNRERIAAIEKITPGNF